MDIVISLALLLTLATIATVRWAGHHFGHALLAGLFIATTSAGPVIRNAVEAVSTALLHSHH